MIKKFLSRDDFSVNRFQVFINTLIGLKKELKKIGSDLLVLDIGPQSAFKELFNELKDAGLPLPTTISWNRDYEPFARKRDEEMQKYFEKLEIEIHHERDHLVIEPWELEKIKGEGYKVYSPFARKWLEIFTSDEVTARIKQQKSALTYIRKLKKGETEKIFNLNWKKIFKDQIEYPDNLTIYAERNQKKVDVEIPPTGTLAAFEKLEKFKKKVDSYADQRDLPAEAGTSGLSVYLKNGTITTAQIIAYFGLEPYKKKKTSRDTFFSELIWREFYYHILYRFPEVENRAFLEYYEKMLWPNNQEWFEVWKEGKTGFPIVDAGMRELKTTGWMHNRVRMIVASFLTKDLLIDWKWGEQYFMEKLLDGDLAPNNGGWQWAASTGCDPQPYFRIFNPWLQSAKFDPERNLHKEICPLS